jgi:hypothetical protein
MAANRKAQSAELRFGPALKALLICFFIGGAGVGYVYQKNLLNTLGEEKRERERKLDRLRYDNAGRERQLSQLNSQRQLEQRVWELNLNLGLPSPQQILVLIDSPPAAAPDPLRRYAQRDQTRALRP